jgi:hypothetical protein
MTAALFLSGAILLVAAVMLHVLSLRALLASNGLATGKEAASEA